MNIIQFPTLPVIEIWGGIVQSSVIVGATGTRSIPSDIGKFRFYVEVVEADGSRIGMWDSTDHANALRQANILAVDFGGRVRDLSGGAS